MEKIVNLDSIQFSGKAFWVLKVESDTCTTKDELFSFLAQNLSFPDYFGRNLDAMYDMLCDLSWIDNDVILYIQDVDGFLSKEDSEYKEQVLELLDECHQEWNAQEEDTDKLRVYCKA